MRVRLLVSLSCAGLLYAGGLLANPLSDKTLPELKTIFDTREGRQCGGYRLSVKESRPDEQKKAVCSAYANSLGLDISSLTDPAVWEKYMDLSQAEQCRQLIQERYSPSYLKSQGCTANPQ